MHDMGEYGTAPVMTEDRIVYVRYLRTVHDDLGFRQARFDSLPVSDVELAEVLFEAEMLANYGVL